MIIYNYENLEIPGHNERSSVKINNKLYLCEYQKPSIETIVNLCNDYYKTFEYNDEFQIYLTGSFLSRNGALARNIDLIISKTSDIKDYDKIYKCLYFLTDTALKKYNVIVKAEYYDDISNINDHYKNLFNCWNSDIKLMNESVVNLFKSYGESLSYIHTIERRSDESKDTTLFILPNYNVTINEEVHNTIQTNSGNTLYTLNIDSSFKDYNFKYLFKDIVNSENEYIDHYYSPLMLFNGNKFNEDICELKDNDLVYKQNFNYQP